VNSQKNLKSGKNNVEDHHDNVVNYNNHGRVSASTAYFVRNEDETRIFKSAAAGSTPSVVFYL